MNHGMTAATAAVPPLFRYGLPPSAAGNRIGAASRMLTAAGGSALRSSMASRMRTAGNATHVNRPMTAVRAAGYTSAGGRSELNGNFLG